MDTELELSVRRASMHARLLEHLVFGDESLFSMRRQSTGEVLPAKRIVEDGVVLVRATFSDVEPGEVFSMLVDGVEVRYQTYPTSIDASDLPVIVQWRFVVAGAPVIS